MTEKFIWSAEDEHPCPLFGDGEDPRGDAICEAIELAWQEDGELPEAVTIWAWKPKENRIIAHNDAVDHVNGIIDSYEEEYSHEDEDDFRDRFDKVAIRVAIRAIEILLRSMKPGVLEEVHEELVNVREWVGLSPDNDITLDDGYGGEAHVSELIKGGA